ncbi:RNA polymerase factor sigma-54 [Yunchengibacter salinarum]|uniref:RNA polymerase factor sigma-54 n=1 Tax=Yunchengibacter salinarum TaxID=3133399 RepID=UPI0035B57374
MALGPRLDIKQSQQLVMTPQLQQAIKLLQLSNLELEAAVSEEVERNPVLEFGEGEPTYGVESDRGEGGGTESPEDLYESGGDSGRGDSGAADDTGDGGMIASDRGLDSGSDTQALGEAALDASYENIYNHDSGSDAANPSETAAAAGGSGSLGYDGGGAVKGSGGVDSERTLEATLAAATNLHDYLSEQMQFTITDASDRLLAAHIIDSVSDAGYIDPQVLDDIAERLEATPARVEAVLHRLQTLEPSGVFARSLGECLALQLKEQNRLDPAMQALLDNLGLLARRDFPALKRLCGVDGEDLTEMMAEIQALNPKPGHLFDTGEAQPVVPDVFVTKDKKGAWKVELNADTLPRVLVNSSYVSELQQVGGGKETRSFVSDCVSGANWLVKALDQRARTILKVSTCIITKQEAFFEHGVHFMKPMTLKDVAEEIDMHESTVSRVTSNKYMATPRGMFELKYFFSSAISSSSGGDSHSAEAVKFRIRELVDREDPKKILSDDKLVAILKAEGIDIARRTVAKYREAQNIPSSVQRRRLKKTRA